MRAGVLDFDSSIAKVVGINASILFAFLRSEQEKTDGAFVCGSDAILRATTLTRRQQGEARKRLEDASLLSQERKGMPAALYFKVKTDVGLGLIKPPHGVRAPARAISRAEVAGGFYDSRTPEENREDDRLLKFMVTQWAHVWGKNKARILISAPRRKTWRAAINEGVTPSMFLRAIWGMKHDEWPERKNRCDLPYVLRHMDRWLDLFERHGFSDVDTAGMRRVKGVTVPVDYQWDQNDEHLLEMGNTFDPVSRRWTRESNGSIDRS